MDPEIPSILEQYRGPRTATQSIVALIIRGFSIIFVQSSRPHVPREYLTPMENLIEKLEKLIERASTPGKLEYGLLPIPEFTWDEDGRKTDYFFIDGSSFHEKDGYEWRLLTDLGVDQTLTRIESVTVFSRLFEAYLLMERKRKDDADGK
ncbi:hypothetical protein BJX65DRAFT_306171 [Aspergillus insuetus]